MTIATALGVTRRWTRLQVDEVVLARIHAGFHYRFLNGAVREMGRKIAGIALRMRSITLKQRG